MKYLLFFLTLTTISVSYSQDSIPQIPPYLIGKIEYPVFNQHLYMGVIKTANTELSFDANSEYKVILDVYDKVKDSMELLVPLREVARFYNLAIINGASKDKLKIGAVIHGHAIDAILKNENYKEKFKVDNPNLELINQLSQNGVQFYVCGQNLGMLNIPEEHINPEINITLSAKTAFIYFGQKGYTYMNINED